MSWLKWFKRPPIKGPEDELYEDKKVTLLQLVALVKDKQEKVEELHRYLASLKHETARLEELPTTKKLRARIEAQQDTIRWQSERLQEALRRAEDLACEMKLQNEGMVCVASGERHWK